MNWNSARSYQLSVLDVAKITGNINITNWVQMLSFLVGRIIRYYFGTNNSHFLGFYAFELIITFILRSVIHFIIIILRTIACDIL